MLTKPFINRKQLICFPILNISIKVCQIPHKLSFYKLSDSIFF